jgi:hypothetical protein
MGNTHVTQVVVTPGGTLNKNTQLRPFELFNADGTPAGTVNKQAAQANTTAADLTALKVDFNNLLAKLRSAGIIAT